MRFALPLFLLFTACSPAVRLKMKERQDTGTLAAAVNDYWLKVRWNDPGGAAAFLETPEEKLKLGRLLSDPQIRMTDVSVVQVVVGDELEEARLPETREGVVVVRIEGYDVRRGRLDVVTLEQHWVRSKPASWKVDADQSPLGADRPW
ncbi:MAG: hypothetical protein Q8P18_04205 [Pseudomonadota bacterium]|nr:hypothetical protein [Pseudomonadota bacterium]